MLSFIHISFLSLVIMSVQNTNQIHEGELPVDPYVVENANAGAIPMKDDNLYIAFGGKEGVSRIVGRFVDGVQQDERINKIFMASDFVRLERTLNEQFCYLLGGPCDYTGRDMVSVHEDHGITTREFNAVVEVLQQAMYAEGIPSRQQNRFLAKLAPMHRDIVTR